MDQKINETPTLDKMADEGKKFSNFYVSSPYVPLQELFDDGMLSSKNKFWNFDGLRVLFPGQGIGLSNEGKNCC